MEVVVKIGVAWTGRWVAALLRLIGSRERKQPAPADLFSLVAGQPHDLGRFRGNLQPHALSPIEVELVAFAEGTFDSLDSRDPDARGYNKILAWAGRNPIAMLTRHHPDQLEVIELTP